MSKTVKLRAVGELDHEKEVRDTLAWLVKGGQDDLGMAVVSEDILDKRRPALLISVPEDEGEGETGGMFLVTVQRISAATVGEGVF